MNRFGLIITIVLFAITGADLRAQDRTIGVFVALADNEHQGLVPVPKAIGNGDDPDRNLYWGTAEGFKGVFGKSMSWKIVDNAQSVTNQDVLRFVTYRSVYTNLVIAARAYRGSAMRKCIEDFESAVREGSFDLVVFIGHNGLMDFELPVSEKPDKQKNRSDCIVLCCKSAEYFRARIEALGGRPILLTSQFMYPGAFILHDIIDIWASGGSLEEIRQTAGKSYAKNQKISEKAGTGIFASLER